MIEVVPAKPIHVNRIANNMRAIDRLECSMMGHTAKEALRLGLLGSTMAWVVLIDGVPEAMFGVTPISMLESKGRPWLLMTDIAGTKSVSLVRLGRVYTAQLHRHYSLLENWVHADNVRTIRWLSRLGYAVGAVDVIKGHPMRLFVRLR